MASERAGCAPRTHSGGSVTDRASTRSSRRHGVLAGFALIMALGLVVAACGGDDSSSGKQKGSTQSTGLVGLKEDSSKPTPGGSVTYALPAETTGGYCLPEAQLAF